MDWGRRARPEGLEQHPGWRPRVGQTGDPEGRQEPSLSPCAQAVWALRLQGPSRHKPVERRRGDSRPGVRDPKAQHPPGLGSHAWSGPGRGARAPRLAPAPGAEARAEEARRPAEQRPQARGAGLRAQPHCGDSSPRPGPGPAAVAAVAVAAAAAATAAALPGIAGPGLKPGVGSPGPEPGPRWGALCMRLRLGEGRGAALGESSRMDGEPLPWPRGERAVGSECGVSSFSPNGNRSGFSWLVGKGSSSRRSGGWGRRGEGKGREGREDGGGLGARVCARAAGLAFGQSSRTMLQPRGQRNSLDRAPRSSTWVSAAAGGKKP